MGGTITRINPNLNRARTQATLSHLSRLISVLRRTSPNSVLLRRVITLRDKIRDGRRLNSREFRLVEDLLNKFKNNPQLSQADRAIVETAVRELVAERGRVEANAPVNNPAAAQQNNQQPNQNVANSDGLLRNQLLNPVANLKVNLLNLTQSVSLTRVFEALKNLPVEQVVRTVPGQVRVENTTSVSEIIGRLVLNLVIDRLLKDIIKNTRQVGEITRENFQKAVEQINQELRNSVVEVRAKEQAAVRKEKEVAKARENDKEVAARSAKESRTADPADRVVVEVAYDKKGNVIGLEVKGRIRDAEAARSARELVTAREREALPVLAESALRLIQANPEARADIVRFVAEVFGRTTAAPEHIKVNDPTPVAVPAAQAENAFAAETGLVSEPILAEVIRSLVTEPKQAVNQQFAAARVEIAKAILAQAPQTALPTLLKEHAKLAENHPAREVVESLIVETAKTAEGRKYVLKAFVDNAAKPLISSEVGHQVVVQTVQAIMAEARAEQTGPKSAAATLQNKKGVAQLVEITRMVARANVAKLPADKMSYGVARDFIETSVQAQRVVKLIGPKNLAKLEKQEAKPSKVATTNYGKTKAPRRRKAALRSRTVRSRQALRKLVQHAENAKLLIPKHLFYIIGNHYAGLAGFNGIKDSRVAQPYLATERAPENRATSALRRVIAAMEADMARAVSRNIPTTAAKTAISALSAEIMVYGLVMRRVKAAIEKADELIQKLRQEGKLNRIIKLVADGQLEQAIQELDHELYQQNPELIAYAA